MPTLKSRFDELLVSPEFLRDPYPLLHELREQDPVYWSDSIGGWLLTRYDDVVTSFKETSLFSNENRLTKTVDYLPLDQQAKYKAVVEHYATKGLIHSDPPDHTRLRGLVTQEFTPKVVEQMLPQIEKVVNGLIDSVEGNRQMDVVADFAMPLPVNVIADLLGIPASDRHLIREWTDDILAFQGVNKPSPADLSRAQKGITAIRPYIQEMIEERRRRPRSDLASRLVAHEATDDRASEAELMSTFVTLIIAGHETTLSLISSAIYLLLSHPEQFELLKQNPELLESAIEEILRYESPVSRQARLMKGDTQLGGKHIRKGEIVFQMLNAANRDPAYFSEPNKFDVQRKKNRHLAFGLGAHFCAGAVLARAETKIAIDAIRSRLPKLQLMDQSPDWELGKRTSRMLRSLHVQF